MQEQDIKRGNYKNVEGEKLGELLTELFGSFKKDGDTHLVEFVEYVGYQSNIDAGPADRTQHPHRFLVSFQG